VAYGYPGQPMDEVTAVVTFILLIACIGGIVVGATFDWNSKSESQTLTIGHLERHYVKGYHYYLTTPEGVSHRITGTIYDELQAREGCTVTVMFHGTVFVYGSEILEGPFCPGGG